jgi:predicted PurR-regulated permease PerM
VKFSCLKRKNAKNTSTQILKYPREATPIPGPHLGRSELFNRSISATTTASSLASSFLSFFFFFFCVFLAVFAVVSERKKFFSFVKFFFSLTFPRKRAAKREEFSVTFHKTTNSKRADIITSSHFYGLVIIRVSIDCALNLLPLRKNTFARSGVV